MSDHLTLQRRLSKRLLRDRPGVPEGMQMVYEAIRGKSRKDPWGLMAEISWSAGLERYVAWLNTLAGACVPASSLEMLWLEVPSELNPAVTSILGFPRFMRELSEFGVPSQEAVWPQAEQTLDDSVLHPLIELEQVLVAVGWRESIGTASEHERLESKVLAIGHAYTLLLAINGLPRSRVPSLAEPDKGLAVTMGLHDGDVEPVGLLRGQSWERFPDLPARRAWCCATGPSLPPEICFETPYRPGPCTPALREGAMSGQPTNVAIGPASVRSGRPRCLCRAADAGPTPGQFVRILGPRSSAQRQSAPQPI